MAVVVVDMEKTQNGPTVEIAVERIPCAGELIKVNRGQDKPAQVFEVLQIVHYANWTGATTARALVRVLERR